MSSEADKPQPALPAASDGSQVDLSPEATDEQLARARQMLFNTGGWLPRQASTHLHEYDYDGSADAIAIANWEAIRQQQHRAAVIAATTGAEELFVPPPLPVLVSNAVITRYGKTSEGALVRAVTVPLCAIIAMIQRDQTLMYQVDPRKWEEIIAAQYEASGLFDRVILTPRSGDCGRDVIAEKDGFGSVRLIESVKRYKPGNEVTADEVRALLGVLSGDQNATKGIVSTTWRFAPRLREDPFIKPFLPYRLELVDGPDLVKRLAEYTKEKGPANLS
jgi:restriction system protein